MINNTPNDIRKQIRFRNLSVWGKIIVAFLCLLFVIAPVWLLSKDEESPFWFWRNMPRILLYTSPFIAIGIYWLYHIMKLKKKFFGDKNKKTTEDISKETPK